MKVSHSAYAYTFCASGAFERVTLKRCPSMNNHTAEGCNNFTELSWSSLEANCRDCRVIVNASAPVEDNGLVCHGIRMTSTQNRFTSNWTLEWLMMKQSVHLWGSLLLGTCWNPMACLHALPAKQRRSPRLSKPILPCLWAHKDFPKPRCRCLVPPHHIW